MLAWIVGCGPSVGAPSAGSSESTTTTTGGSLTATATSSPSSSESSTTGSADITSGETTALLDVGDTTAGDQVDACDHCRSDEVCVERLPDGCPATPQPLECIPLHDACEKPSCDDTACAQTICGLDLCLGFDAEACFGATGGFVCLPTGDGPIQCDVFAHDCPEGEKCVSWSTTGGRDFDAAHCTPIAASPVGLGEACMADGYATSGIDDCGLAAQCLEVDPDTLVGICRASCIGGAANPSCDDPSMTCSIIGQYFAWCLP